MSKDVIKKFLQDAKAYDDNTQIRIGETVVSLGDLRALDAEERTSLNAKIAEVNKQRDEVLTLSGKAQAAYQAATDLQAKAAAAAAAAPAAGGTPNPWETDGWLKPVDARFKEFEKKNEELHTTVKQLATILGNAATTFSNKGWDDEFRAIDQSGFSKTYTRDELLEFAKKNSLLNPYNLPSLSRAHDVLTSEERRKVEREKAIEEGRQRGIQETLAGRMPQPNVPGPGMSVPPPKIPANGDVLGNLYEESIKDPELRGLIEQMGTLGLA